MNAKFYDAVPNEVASQNAVYGVFRRWLPRQADFRGVHFILGVNILRLFTRDWKQQRFSQLQEYLSLVRNTNGAFIHVATLEDLVSLEIRLQKLTDVRFLSYLLNKCGVCY